MVPADSCAQGDSTQASEDAAGFTNMRALQRHMNSIHEGNELETCDSLKIKFKQHSQRSPSRSVPEFFLRPAASRKEHPSQQACSSPLICVPSMPKDKALSERQRTQKNKVNCESQARQGIQTHVQSVSDNHPRVDLIGCTFSSSAGVCHFTSSGPVLGQPAVSKALQQLVTDVVSRGRAGQGPLSFGSGQAEQVANILVKENLLPASSVKRSIDALKGKEQSDRPRASSRWRLNLRSNWPANHDDIRCRERTASGHFRTIS